MISQRDIVLIPFLYSDLSAQKKRPVLVISNKNYNSNNQDVICCAITSKLDALGVKIKNSDLEEGNLKLNSVVKPGKIYSIFKPRIIRKIGKLNISKTKEVIENVYEKIKMDNDEI